MLIGAPPSVTQKTKFAPGDDTAMFLVNDHVVNALTAAHIKKGAGLTPLTRGKLQIQSESAEVSYRRVRLRPITGIPTDLLKSAGLTAR